MCIVSKSYLGAEKNKVMFQLGLCKASSTVELGLG